MKYNDRVLVLKKNKDSDTGLLDPRVFEGKNNLHAYMEEHTGFWKFKYEHGQLPPSLRAKFTSFKLAKEAADYYFKQKNIDIVEVRDIPTSV